MPGITTPFEDVQPFPDVDFPVTFRVEVTYRNPGNWTLDEIALPSQHENSWITLRRSHPLWDILHSYAISHAGYEAIEAKIAQDTESACFEYAEA